MRNHLLVLSMTLASVTVGAVCLVVPWNTASATDTPPAINGALVSAPASGAPAIPALTYGVSQVVKMYQSGINKEVIVNYINSTALPYHLTADGIIYLQSTGFPQEITQALISRDGQLQQQAAQQFYQQQQMAAAANAAALGAPTQPAPAQSPIVLPTTPAPDVTDIGTDYGYPYYDGGYPYYYGGYGWPVVIGGGWGWAGWGRGRGYGGGFRGGFGRGGFRGGFSGGGFRSSFGGGGFRGGSGGGHGGGGHR